MKLLTLIFTLLFTSQAMAHTDHALGDGLLHYTYHVVFLALFVAVVFKATKYFKAKNQDSRQN